MTVFEIAVNSTTPFPWPFLIVGAIMLPVGILFVVRPRQSGEAWRKTQQALQPYWTIREIPIALVVAVGCSALAVVVICVYFFLLELR